MTPFVFAPRPASTMGVATRCTARLAWCACALRGGQSAWRATRGAKSRLGWGSEGSRARWGAVARWGCSSRACRGLVLDLACAGACRTVIRAVADLLHVRELAVWTRRAELLGAAASSRSCGSGSRSCGSGCGSRSRGSGSGSGGEMSRPGPAALLALKGRMANSAGDNSVPGTIAAAEAVCAAAPPRCSRNAPLTQLVAPAEPAPEDLPGPCSCGQSTGA